MASTKWVLCTAGGAPIMEFDDASTKKFSAVRNQWRQATISMSHDDPAAYALISEMDNGVPKLVYWRDGECRLTGALTALQSSLDADGQDVLTAVFRDAFGCLYMDGSSNGALMLGAASITQNPAQRVSDVIITLHDQGLMGGASADLVAGTVTSLSSALVTYDILDHVGRWCLDMAELYDFDIEVVPLDPHTSGHMGVLNIESMGSDMPDLLWGFGDGTLSNVHAVTRQITPPRNWVIQVDNASNYSSQTDSASLAKYGSWPVTEQASGLIDNSFGLDNIAVQQLRSDWVKVMTFQPDPATAPQPFDDFWLGDTGRFDGRHGAFTEQFSPRVNGITITEDETGLETHEIELEVES